MTGRDRPLGALRRGGGHRVLRASGRLGAPKHPIPDPASLVAMAMHPPASGSEADDWRVRTLAELLVQAIATDDAALVRAVDDAATACGPARSRFVERLHAVRRHIGPEPRGDPVV